MPCGTVDTAGKWTFDKRRGTRCPEAGTPFLYQHDGARPHTAKINKQTFARQSKMKGFKIEVFVQPPQRPDLNVDDLAFFHSLQTDVSLGAKENQKDLLQARASYPKEKMDSVWYCLYASFHGVLESRGDNDYARHQGSRAARRVSDILDRSVSGSSITAAERKLEQLQRQMSSDEADLSDMSSSDWGGWFEWQRLRVKSRTTVSICSERYSNYLLRFD